MKRVFELIISIALMSAVGAVGAEPTKAKLSKEDASLIKKLKEEVASELNDPNSAQFRNVALNRKTKTICGEINGKNAYGGYVGFRWFGRSEGNGGVIYPAMPNVAREKIIELLNRPTNEEGEPNTIQCAVK